MRHGKPLDKYLFIELHSVYLLGVLSKLLSLLGVLRQKRKQPLTEGRLPFSLPETPDTDVSAGFLYFQRSPLVIL